MRQQLAAFQESSARIDERLKMLEAKHQRKDELAAKIIVAGISSVIGAVLALVTHLVLRGVE